MSWNEQILLWNQAAVRVMDIRHRVLTGGEKVDAYVLPASVFLFASRGKAMSGGDEAFSKIAPTIIIEPYYDPVKDIALMGDILGKEEEAAGGRKRSRKKVAEAKRQVNEAVAPNETFTIMSFFENRPACIGMRIWAAIFCTST